MLLFLALQLTLLLAVTTVARLLAATYIAGAAAPVDGLALEVLPVPSFQILQLWDLGLTAEPLQISVGGGHVCAVERPDTIRCWGRGLEGQLGQNALEDSLSLSDHCA